MFLKLKQRVCRKNTAVTDVGHVLFDLHLIYIKPIQLESTFNIQTRLTL